MLNIFADALLIAARLGRLPDGMPDNRRRRFDDHEGLRTAETLRTQGR